jgi:glycosyltransferase involved in cell wall biosynthesis
MWTKNGAETLDSVLQRINQVIPPEYVSQKLIVDDHSTDSTREIAKRYGWEVYNNDLGGISNGSNCALTHVETEWFCSFEQDVLIAEDWFKKIYPLINKPKCAVASGCRFTSNPKTVHLLEKFSHNTRYYNPMYGKTLDNTIYKTTVIKSMGFPLMKSNCGIDIVLANLLEQKGYMWYVNYNCISTHMKKPNLRQHFKRIRWYGKAESEIRKKSNLKNINIKLVFLKLPRSIFIGVFIAWKMHYAPITLVYPIEMLCRFKGFIEGKRYL